MYNRLAKAVKLADVIEFSVYHAGFRIADLGRKTTEEQEEFWRLAAMGLADFDPANPYVPSFQTRELTIRLLKEREETGRRLMAMKREAARG